MCCDVFQCVSDVFHSVARLRSLSECVSVLLRCISLGAQRAKKNSTFQKNGIVSAIGQRQDLSKKCEHIRISNRVKNANFFRIGLVPYTSETHRQSVLRRATEWNTSEIDWNTSEIHRNSTAIDWNTSEIHQKDWKYRRYKSRTRMETHAISIHPQSLPRREIHRKIFEIHHKRIETHRQSVLRRATEWNTSEIHRNSTAIDWNTSETHRQSVLRRATGSVGGGIF